MISSINLNCCTVDIIFTRLLFHRGDREAGRFAELKFSKSILWFKLYTVDASLHQPLDMSKVAYIEILDNNNKPVIQAKIALKNGDGNGSLPLPVSIGSGKYKLRAYTNWMKNFGADHFFEKIITIVNTQKANETISSPKPDQYDIQFFPEGGNLVNGIQSKVAFKATDQTGKGVAFTGSLLDEQDNVIIKSFQPLKFGMGNFSFTPTSGHHYKAIIDIAGKNKITKELPSVYAEGYVMKVTTGQSIITVTVQTNISTAAELYLFVNTGQSAKFSWAGFMRNGIAHFLITKDKLGDGISHFTVFNSERQPVCERLYFKVPQEYLQMYASTDNPGYAPRKKVTLNILAATQAGKTSEADMSMSVYRLDSLQSPDENNISSYLWLNSELAGTIESPQYYFDSTSIPEAADNLMLTQGWRRFRWEDVLQNKKPSFTYAPEYNGHIITGKVIDTRTGSTAENIESYLSVPGVRTQFSPSRSDASGQVKFEMKEMYGSSEIIVQTNSRVDSLYRVDIANPFFESYSSRKLPSFHFTSDNATNFLTHSIGSQVQNIYLGDMLQQFGIPALDTNPLQVPRESRYLLDNYVRFVTLEEVLREYVLSVNVRKREDKFHVLLYDLANKVYFENDGLVLLDGVPVFDQDKFMKFDPLKIRKVEVVDNKYFLGGNYFDGILNCSTYKGNLADFELDPHATVIDYDGLQLQREFYSPQYATEQQLNSHLPDFRNVLYWSPNIHTNTLGKQTTSFYTSDVKGKYAVVLQGIAADGKSGSNVVTFNVK